VRRCREGESTNLPDPIEQLHFEDDPSEDVLAFLGDLLVGGVDKMVGVVEGFGHASLLTSL
jgi:hypothetical protein